MCQVLEYYLMTVALNSPKIYNRLGMSRGVAPPLHGRSSPINLMKNETTRDTLDYLYHDPAFQKAKSTMVEEAAML